MRAASKICSNKPDYSAGLRLFHPAIENSIFSFGFFENAGNKTEPNYRRKYTGILSTPVYPQTMTVSGSDYFWQGGAIWVNQAGYTSMIQTSSGVDSFASSTAAYSFVGVFFVQAFSNQGSTLNSVFSFANAATDFRSLTVKSDGCLYGNGGATKISSGSVLGRWVTVVLCVAPGGSSYAIVDGLKTTWTAAAAPTPASANRLLIGSDSNGNRYTKMGCKLLHVCDILLPEVLARSMADNPWQIYNPGRKAFFDCSDPNGSLRVQFTKSDGTSDNIACTSDNRVRFKRSTGYPNNIPAITV